MGNHTTHGMTGTKEYNAWCNIKKRCYSKSHAQYGDYGGRGISVCQRWLDSFESFFTDVGRAPSPAHTIDRSENDGNYEPGNVRWATRSEQNSHRRNVVLLTFAGRTQNLSSWAREIGKPLETLQWRRRQGKSVAEILSP